MEAVADPTSSNQITQEQSAIATSANLISFVASVHVSVISNSGSIMTTATYNLRINHKQNIANSKPFKFVYRKFLLNRTINQNLNKARLGFSQNINSALQSQPFVNQHTEIHPPLLQPTPEYRLRSEQLHALQTASTKVCELTDAENLIRLQKALRGETLEAVKRILVHSSCVPHAVSTLKLLCGQSDKILFSLKNKIKTLPQVNPNKN